MFEISSPNKVLFPKEGITKAELIEYYLLIYPYMGPLMKDRALTIQRFPNGIEKSGFFQKSLQEGSPHFLKSIRVKKKDDSYVVMPVSNNKDSLKFLVNQGAITFHTALNTKLKQKPDKVIFDLDPTLDDFKQVKEAAFCLRDILENMLSLKCFVMTTGSRGVHVIVPIIPSLEYEEVKDFAKNVASYMCDLHPKKYTTELRKSKRENRIFIDYLRNSFSQTAVTPYSVRPFANAPIAMPISWDELNAAHMHSKFFHLRDIQNSIEKNKKRLYKFAPIRQSLLKAVKKLKKIKAQCDS